jgi:hypothetical protein
MALSLSSSLGKNYRIVNQAAAVASTLDLSLEKSPFVIVSFTRNSVAAGLQNITLPAPTNLGQTILVVCNTAQAGVNVNSSTVLTSTAANMYYSLALGNAALTRVVAPSQTLRFDGGVAGVVGDMLELKANGVCWEVQGFAGTAAAITV